MMLKIKVVVNSRGGTLNAIGRNTALFIDLCGGHWRENIKLTP